MAIPVTIASWLTVARTPLNEAARAAGTPAVVRCTSASNPLPCATPAMTSTALACQGHAPALVSQASRPLAAAETAQAACRSRGCRAAGSLLQVTDAVANPAA